MPNACQGNLSTKIAGAVVGAAGQQRLLELPDLGIIGPQTGVQSVPRSTQFVGYRNSRLNPMERLDRGCSHGCHDATQRDKPRLAKPAKA